jgi:nickel-dependent lactate racemase
MRVTVEFQGERLDLDVPEERLVGSWEGPPGLTNDAVPRLIAEVIENPCEYPPLRQAVVPGDRVAIALGDDAPEPGAVLSAVVRVLTAAGVVSESVTVLTPGPTPAGLADSLPPDIRFKSHDPDDSKALAYLATTTGGRRVYLNRELTDADFVLPVGRISYDPVLGCGGPWGVILPGLCDAATRAEFHRRGDDRLPDAARPGAELSESLEVNWLLGTQFQLGLVGGVAGLVAARAGLTSAVLKEGVEALDHAWGFVAPDRADLVVVGIGRAGDEMGLDDVGRALAAATRLVRRGGKVAVLSRAVGPIGPAAQRLVDARDPRAAATSLKGQEEQPDFATASRIARAVEWADVYLLSAFGSDVVEDLQMVALDRPEEVRRLAAVAGSCLVVSHGDRVGARVSGDSG